MKKLIALLFLMLCTCSMMKAQHDIHYIAVELDDESKQKATHYAETHLPWADANIIAHHMTILHHSGLRATPDDPEVAAKDYVLAWAMAHEGQSVTLTATEVGHSSQAFALLITATTAPSRNRSKHITLATNPTTGGSAVDSNYICHWELLPEPMELKGKVTIYYK